MSTRNDMDDDELDRLLRPTASPSPSPMLRRSLLGQTTRELCSRRRLRRIGMWLGMAACYVAGLGTMQFWTQGSADMPPRPIGELASETVHDAPMAEPATTDQAAAVATDAELPAAVLERLADAVADDEYRDLYRRAGDRHMQETGDLAAALRCYRRTLDATPPQELTVSDRDNWLLKALKQARHEEVRHAYIGG